MAKLKIVYWHDIPGQVVVRKGHGNTRIRLSNRFAKAIERASYRIRKQGEDALFDPWHSVDQPFSGDIDNQAKALVNQLEQQYSDAVLDQLVRASGKRQNTTN